MTERRMSLSLDLDNKWSYLKTHGSEAWRDFPSYLDLVVPRILTFLHDRGLRITFFIVGQDAALEKNHAALRSIAAAGHEIASHSFNHEPWLHLYTDADLDRELERAEDAIQRATGAVVGAVVPGIHPVTGAVVGAVLGGVAGAVIKGRQYYRDTRGYCYYVDQYGNPIYDYNVRC